MYYFLIFLFIFWKNLFLDFFVFSKNNLSLNKRNTLFNKFFFLDNSFNNKKKCKFNIVIDPGHGGYDPGAIGFYGSKEKDINLLISKKLYKFLNLDKKFNVFLVRSKDSYISLRDRLRIARDKDANLFLSIHVNSIDNNKHIKGASFWLFSMLNKYKYMNMEKKREFFLNGKLNYLLLNLNKRMSQLNFYLASEIINQFRNIIILHKNYLQYADLFILSLFYIPSILIEVGYISNPIEEMKLINEFYQYKLAKYIYLGINNFINKICMLKYKYNDY